MSLKQEDLQKYAQRMMLARFRLLNTNGFFGLLLMHMIFAADEHLGTLATDGVRIFFDPKFLDQISDEELDFVLMHEIMHVVLQHCIREKSNSGKPYDHELFNIACDIVVNSNILLCNNNDLFSITLQNYGESMHLAPDGKEGYLYTAEEVYAMLRSFHAKDGGSDKDTGRQKGKSGTDRQRKNSCVAKQEVKDANSCNDVNDVCSGHNCTSQWDDHSRWGTAKEDPGILSEEWNSRIVDACEAISIRDPGNKRGLLPLFAERILEALKDPKTDWREMLNDFVQEEITDYSFTPPDRRFDDSPFFLPDFNEKDDYVEDILFMIDTSGSMSNKLVTAAYSEVKGAIDQFDGNLKGWLGFFDAKVIEPHPFEDEEEFHVIRPKGGGGTDFHAIFQYVKDHMQDRPPASIIILTDGFAPFPKESEALGIPVLWMITNKKITPPWGKVARIT